MKTIEYINQTQTAFHYVGTDRGCLFPVASEDRKQCVFPVRVRFLSRTLCIRSGSFLRVTDGNGRGRTDKGPKLKMLKIPFNYGISDSER